MNKELIEKYSVIIAEFMGIEVTNEDDQVYYSIEIKDEINGSYFQKVNEMSFHTDWNEIHNVFEKLTTQLELTNDKKLYNEKLQDYYEIITLCMLGNKLYETFLEIGKCIEYLNTIKYITQ